MRRRNQNPHHPGGGNRGGHNNRPRRYNNNSRGSSFNAGEGGPNDHANAARIRRHATTQREKYYNMGRDALSSGDRVQAEYYFQHVEHYTRVLGELPPEEPRFNNNNRFQNNGNGQQQQFNQQGNPGDGQQQDSQQQGQENMQDNRDYQNEEPMRAPPPAASALPSFITGGRPRPQGNVAPRSAPEEE